MPGIKKDCAAAPNEIQAEIQALNGKAHRNASLGVKLARDVSAPDLPATFNSRAWAQYPGPATPSTLAVGANLLSGGAIRTLIERHNRCDAAGQGTNFCMAVAFDLSLADTSLQ